MAYNNTEQTPLNDMGKIPGINENFFDMAKMSYKTLFETASEKLSQMLDSPMHIEAMLTSDADEACVYFYIKDPDKKQVVFHTDVYDIDDYSSRVAKVFTDLYQDISEFATDVNSINDENALDAMFFNIAYKYDHTDINSNGYSMMPLNAFRAIVPVDNSETFGRYSDLSAIDRAKLFANVL